MQFMNEKHDIIKIGEYIWKVLDTDEENECALLILSAPLDEIGNTFAKPYAEIQNDFNRSSLREYLNNVFPKKFSNEKDLELLDFDINLKAFADNGGTYGISTNRVGILTEEMYNVYRKKIPFCSKYWCLATPVTCVETFAGEIIKVPKCSDRLRIVCPNGTVEDIKIVLSSFNSPVNIYYRPIIVINTSKVKPYKTPEVKYQDTIKIMETIVGRGGYNWSGLASYDSNEYDNLINFFECKENK